MFMMNDSAYATNCHIDINKPMEQNPWAFICYFRFGAPERNLDRPARFRTEPHLSTQILIGVSKLVRLRGIEPPHPVPETSALSTELQAHMLFASFFIIAQTVYFHKWYKCITRLLRCHLYVVLWLRTMCPRHRAR